MGRERLRVRKRELITSDFLGQALRSLHLLWVLCPGYLESFQWVSLFLWAGSRPPKSKRLHFYNISMWLCCILKFEEHWPGGGPVPRVGSWETEGTTWSQGSQESPKKKAFQKLKQAGVWFYSLYNYYNHKPKSFQDSLSFKYSVPFADCILWTV